MSPLPMSPLRTWRLQHGLTLQEVSDLCGISASMISRVERGQKRLSPMTKVRLARALGARVSELFDTAARPTANSSPSRGEREHEAGRNGGSDAA